MMTKSMRRSYLLGYCRAHAKARAEMDCLCSSSSISMSSADRISASCRNHGVSRKEHWENHAMLGPRGALQNFGLFALTGQRIARRFLPVKIYVGRKMRISENIGVPE